MSDLNYPRKPYLLNTLILKITTIDKEIHSILELDIIEISTSPWSSLMMGIEKKNGFERLYLSGCKINTQIILKYLNSIDMTTGFCQCPLK